MYGMYVCTFGCVWLFAAPQTVAHQALLSMVFSRQEYWSGLPFPSPGDFPDPGIKPGSPTLQADALPSKPPGKPRQVKISESYAQRLAKLWMQRKSSWRQLNILIQWRHDGQESERGLLLIWRKISGLDRRPYKPQHSLKLKPNSEQVPNSHQF